MFLFRHGLFGLFGEINLKIQTTDREDNVKGRSGPKWPQLIKGGA